jgi:ABC-2 type transport system permease protein
MATHMALPADMQPERRSRLYWAVSDCLEMTKRSIKHIRRNLDQLLGVAIQPIMFTVLFRYIFGGAINTGETSYVNFLIAGILVQTAAFGATTTAVSLRADLDRGIVDRFRSLPMYSPALLVGHVSADLIRNIISSIIMLIVGFIVGFRPTATPAEWALVAALLVAFTLAFSWLSAIMGLLAKSIEAVQWLSFLIVLPLTFASSAFVPSETMPGVVRAFSENQPITRVIEAMRAWLVGTPIGDHGVAAFAWCVGILIVSAPVAVWLFRRKVR